MMNDAELLRRYAEENSAVAFGQLVGRYLNLVYSAALRQVGGDVHLAEDVTQTVFADLARKAASLTSRADLSGWLYTSAHFAASNMVRRESRRRARELEAYIMQEPSVASDTALDWEPLRPALDQAMHELNETDREAVLLRYFQRLAYAEVGAKLGLGENAARMRVERALEKLRAILSRSGIISTGTSLAAVLAERTVEAAPPGLAAAVLRRPRVWIPAATGIVAIILRMIKVSGTKIGAAVLVGAAVGTFLVAHEWTAGQKPAGNAAAQNSGPQVSSPASAPLRAAANAPGAADSLSTAGQYELEGNITLRSLNSDGSTNREYQGDFKVFVRDDAWLIQVHETGQFGNKVLREIGSTNGTEVFETVTALDQTGPANDSRIPGLPANPAIKVPTSATVSRQRVPVGPLEGSFVGPLWLMFASGGYFRSLTNNFLTPVYDWHVSPLANNGGPRTVMAEWELLNGPGSLPYRVVYETPGGGAAAVYQATGTTNLGGLVLPTGFTSTQQRGRGLSAMSGEAAVTSIRPICSRSNLLPAIAGKVSIHDLRLASQPNVEGVSYISDHWVSVSQVSQVYPAPAPPEMPPPAPVMPPVNPPGEPLQQPGAGPNRSYVPFRDAILAADPAAKLPAQGPWTISVDDLKNPMSLTADLAGQGNARGRKNPFSSFLWSRLSEKTQSGLAGKYAGMRGHGYQSYKAGPELDALVADLNGVIQGGMIYRQEAFTNINLSGDTLKLLAQGPTGGDAVRLNRLLLEDALPLQLIPRPKIIADPASNLWAFVEFRHSQSPGYTSVLISLYREDGAKLWRADLDPALQGVIKAAPSARNTAGRAEILNAGVSDVRFSEKDIVVTLINQSRAGVDLKTGSVRLLPSQ